MCYRSLYFDALLDMEAKQQVNRIAKNMIEYVYPAPFFKPLLTWCGCSSVTFYLFRLTYDATLAELTSLEETMRSMMDDGQIHQDVIAKLWQVYSSFTHTRGCPNNFCFVNLIFFEK
jgi:condensin complex subunit 1